MVNNVVKSSDSPVQKRTGEHFSFCGVAIVAWKSESVKSFLRSELRGYKQRKELLKCPLQSIE